MAQSRTPSEPGADLLDEAIDRLRAMKTTVGLVLARALEAAHSRFIVFGSTLALYATKVEELERRDNISWPALEERLAAIEKRLASLEMGQVASAEWRGNVLERLEACENRITDELIRIGLSARSEQANATATRAILRAALAVLDPPMTAREYFERGAARRAPQGAQPGDGTA